jgi:hypothetical protein
MMRAPTLRHLLAQLAEGGAEIPSPPGEGVHGTASLQDGFRPSRAGRVPRSERSVSICFSSSIRDSRRRQLVTERPEEFPPLLPGGVSPFFWASVIRHSLSFLWCRSNA